MGKAAKKLMVTAAVIPTAGDNVTGQHNNPPVVLEPTEGLPVTSLPRDVVDSWAIKTAAVLNDDDEMKTEMRETWAADDKVKRVSATMLSLLKSNFTDEELRTFPVPGLKLKDMHKGDPRHSEEYPTTTTGKDGVTKNSTGNKYDDLLDRLDWVASEKALVKYWTDVIQDAAKIGEQDRIKYPNKQSRAGQLNLAKTHVQNARKYIRDAMRVFFLMDGINNRMPLVGADFRQINHTQTVDVDGKPFDRQVFYTDETMQTTTFEGTKWPCKVPTNARKCIAVWSKTESGADYKGDDYTVGGFLQFDLEEAIKNGGTYDALVATAKRETEAPTTALPDMKQKNRDEYLFNVATFFATGNHTDLLLKDFANGKASDGVILAIQKIATECDIVRNSTDFQRQWAALSAKPGFRTDAAFIKSGNVQ